MPHPMPAEPEINEFIRRCDAFYPANAVSASIGQQRAWYDALCAAFDAPRPPGLASVDAEIMGIATRSYHPAELRRSTVLLYLHGGGFVVGSLKSHDAICAEIAHAVGAELVAVDYRLAPEDLHPAASDDVAAVADALIAEGRRLVVVGDSAGGNLAAGLCIRARDAGMEGIVGQALIYPGLGGDLGQGSFLDMAHAPGLTTADVAYYRELYRADPEDAVAHPLAASSFTDLPPAYITSAHFDPLRDDARIYAERMSAAGIAVTYRNEPQMIHAWLRARHMSPGARDGFAALCRGIEDLCGKE
ncbi:MULTISPECIES: alpha/beta hydrolase [unclassified Aureimonas]|uniref:alpha/beta hydrolase n=1 Tax=unclassified Aureimonas TaxID=2615206 RepID=UPI0006F63AD0|nr:MULTISPECIES: alpha/beta hydrolase [unclassified Aureimonas]KQT64093.1 carboxylesterase [Aureimonas sp. Leaf427]KQT81283.1 carboxylesterase [Aureimonas sp. Leaf460]